MLNLLLALFMSLAISVSGTAGVPALPDTETSTVVRNITVGFNGESVTLNPELVLAAAFGQEQSAVHFEIRNGDGVLLPMSLELGSDQARFTLMNSGRVYTITDNALLGMIMQGADGKTISQMKDTLNKVANLIVSYETANARLYEEDLRDRFNAVLLEELLAVSGAVVRDAEVEVDGALYPARHMDMNIDMDMLLQAVQAMTACGDVDVAAIAQGFNNVVAGAQELSNLEELIPGLSLSGFSMLSTGNALAPTLLSAAEEEAEPNSFLPNMEMAVDLLLADGEGLDYTKYTATISDLDNVTSEKLIYESIVQGNQLRESSHSQSTGYEGTETLMEYDVVSTVSEDGTENVQMDVNMEYAGKDGIFAMGGDSYRIICSGTVEGTMAADGVLDIRMDLNLTDRTDSEEIDLGNITGSYSESAASESVRTGKLEAALNLKDDEMDHALSFACELERTRSDPTDYFSGGQEMKLEDTSGNSMAMLRLEALGLAANISTLGAEESILQLGELFAEDGAALLRALDLAPTMQMTTAPESIEVHSVRTLEEARRIYLGQLPVFTPPEGYELEYIDVGSTYYSACYLLEGETEDEDRWFFVDVDSYGAEDREYSVRYAALQEDGTIENVSGSPLEIYTDERGMVQYVLITREDMYIYVTFDEGGADLAGLQSVLSGFGPGAL